MRLNKIIVGASAFAMAAALSAGVAPQASAEESGNTASPAATFARTISIDYDAQELTVARGDDKKISVSFPTVKDKVIKGEKNICSYDVSNSGVTVDLSTLNVTKDNYIKVWGDKNTTPVMIKIPASVQLGKATVNYKDEANKLTVAKKKETAPFDAKIQYATSTSDWSKAAEQTAAKTETKDGIDITNYLNLGATLRVRVAASAKSSNVTMKAAATKDGTETALTPVEYSVNKSDTKVLTYETEATFASKEVKAKVAKRANTPKVKVDYKLGTVTLPKNAMFRVNGYTDDGTTPNVTKLGKWTAGDKKVLSAADAPETKVDISGGKVLDLKNGGGVDVRIAATDKKPASNYLAFNYAGKVTPLVAAVTAPSSSAKPEDAACDSAVAKLTNKKVSAVANISADDFMNAEIDYARTKAVYKTNGSVKTATSGAITLKNTDKKYAYDIVTVTGADAPKADFKKGVKTVKASGKDVTIKVKNDNEYTVYVRRAAISKGTDATWATDWVKVMTISKDHSVPTVVNSAKNEE